MKYITLFETDAAYKAATLDLPNVSLIEETMSVGYKPYVPETRLVCKYNVTNTSNPTPLRTSYDSNIFKSMEIDGVMLDELVTDYTFDTIGEHTVKYELYDETKLGYSSPVFYNNNLIECIIPNSVTTIDMNTFYGCSGLTSIVIPDSVTTIGSGAFSGCSGLTSITIGNCVTSISGGAFEGTDALKVLNYNAKCELSPSFRSQWPNLETVIIGDSTPSIGSGVFSGCTSITNVTIGNSVTSISNSAFAGCSNLVSMTVDSNNTTYDSRNNCNAIIETTTNTLIAGCKNTVIPDNITSIGNGAFAGCSSLTSVVIPDNITSIGDDVFYNCSSLTSCTIGSGVTSIGNSVFYNCSSLTSIVSNATTAPTISNSTFQGIKIGGTLTVPSGSTGYDAWMSTDDYYLGKYNWTKVEK